MIKYLLLFLMLVNSANGSLVSQWLLANDFTDTQGANNGTGVNSPTFGEGPASEALTAMVVNGSSQYANVTYDATLESLSAFTWTAWAKSDKAGSDYTSQGLIVDMGDFPLAGYGIFLFHTTDKVTAYYNSSFTLDCDTVLDTNWHFYALTYDGTTLRLYRDDSEQGSGATVGVLADINPNVPVRIGSQSDAASKFFSGSIADVRFYNTGLDASEVEVVRQEMLGASSGGHRSRYSDGYRNNYRSRYN